MLLVVGLFLVRCSQGGKALILFWSLALNSQEVGVIGLLRRITEFLVGATPTTTCGAE